MNIQEAIDIEYKLMEAKETIEQFVIQRFKEKFEYDTPEEGTSIKYKTYRILQSNKISVNYDIVSDIDGVLLEEGSFQITLK